MHHISVLVFVIITIIFPCHANFTRSVLFEPQGYTPGWTFYFNNKLHSVLSPNQPSDLPERLVIISSDAKVEKYMELEPGTGNLNFGLYGSNAYFGQLHKNPITRIISMQILTVDLVAFKVSDKYMVPVQLEVDGEWVFQSATQAYLYQQESRPYPLTTTLFSVELTPNGIKNVSMKFRSPNVYLIDSLTYFGDDENVLFGCGWGDGPSNQGILFQLDLRTGAPGVNMSHRYFQNCDVHYVGSSPAIVGMVDNEVNVSVFRMDVSKGFPGPMIGKPLDHLGPARDIYPTEKSAFIVIGDARSSNFLLQIDLTSNDSTFKIIDSLGMPNDYRIDTVLDPIITPAIAPAIKQLALLTGPVISLGYFAVNSVLIVNYSE